MLETLTRSEKVGKGILAVIALLPGVAVLTNQLPVSEQVKENFGIAILATSIVAALCVFLLADWVRETKPRTLITSMIGLFVFGLVALFSWQFSYEKYLGVYYDGDERREIALPIIRGPLQEKYSSRSLNEVFANENVGSDVFDEIESRNYLTPIIWAILLILAQIGLTMAILLGITAIALRGNGGR